MKANEIRQRWSDWSKGRDNVSATSAEHQTYQLSYATFFLAEIAAQLSEFNERLGALTGGSLEKQWIRTETK